MSSEISHYATTKVEILGSETLVDISSPQRPLEPSARDLYRNYKAIIRDRNIYYPVAYRLVRELGHGRQGRVFLGLRQGARGCITRHAIKIFDPSIYTSAENYWTDMGRIANQVSELQMVQSPNLTSRDIYEEFNGIGYMQMQVIDGVDLRELLSPGHLDIVKARSTPEEWARFMDVIFRVEGNTLKIQTGIALYIMRQMLRGLETLHEHGFVHSDIKPANIMIDRLGYVKLVDYGRAVKANEKMTMLFGSPLFMAPETHRREPNVIESDIYSVGLVGLEMLRGEPLLDTTGLLEKDLLEFKMSLPDRLQDMLPSYVLQNSQLVRMFRRFIDPDPQKRYHKADEAEAGKQGLRIVHQQLTQLGKDAEYGRELQAYISKIKAAPADSFSRDIDRL
ncbi:MAG TPA: serine/threonine-protein kinase [Kiritimatiellia bacterium]|nr:serine/threonine-protein kinase [Kiritimatiellia bacterium]